MAKPTAAEIIIPPRYSRLYVVEDVDYIGLDYGPLPIGTHSYEFRTSAGVLQQFTRNNSGQFPQYASFIVQPQETATEIPVLVQTS